MILGLDFHDTITYNPEFFKNLINNWNDKVYILSGTPNSQRSHIESKLQELGITNVYKVILSYEYDKDTMTIEHFSKMKKYKLEQIIKHNIDVYFDDNPIYLDFVDNQRILVFQPILSDEYIKKFSNTDKYVCCHFQKNQFKQYNNILNGKYY